MPFSRVLRQARDLASRDYYTSRQVDTQIANNPAWPMGSISTAVALPTTVNVWVPIQYQAFWINQDNNYTCPAFTRLTVGRDGVYRCSMATWYTKVVPADWAGVQMFVNSTVFGSGLVDYKFENSELTGYHKAHALRPMKAGDYFWAQILVANNVATYGYGSTTATIQRVGN